MIIIHFWKILKNSGKLPEFTWKTVFLPLFCNILPISYHTIISQILYAYNAFFSIFILILLLFYHIWDLDLDASVLKDFPNLRIIKRCGSRKEEELVEEFGNYQFSDATYVYDSVLADAFEELISIL